MKSFEDAVTELKLIIDRLEGGNISLEESLAIFENGVELISYCHKKLTEVQKKIQIMVEKSDGEVSWKDYDLED